MADVFVSGLAIVAGLAVAGVGLGVAARRLHVARRASRRTQALRAGIPESWNAWYLRGFSGVTIGTQWLSAAVVWLVWTLAGAALITFGIRLFDHVSRR
jgi:hypothetical protein